MYRFGDAVVRWDQARAAGETGRVGLFAGQFHCNALHAEWWRERAKSGGQMVEQLIHIVDLARHQLGEPQSVYARAGNFFHRDVERYDSDDLSAIVLGYDDGRLGVLNATNGAVPGRWDKLWQIVAERMTGRFTGWNSATLVHTSGEYAQRADRDADGCVRRAARRRDCGDRRQACAASAARRRRCNAQNRARGAAGCAVDPRDSPIGRMSTTHDHEATTLPAAAAEDSRYPWLSDRPALGGRVPDLRGPLDADRGDAAIAR